MRKLKNTHKDKYFLYQLLSIGQSPKASVTLYYFESDHISDLKEMTVIGNITKIDLKSGYCNWINELGEEMPCVNIDCITLHNFYRKENNQQQSLNNGKS